MLEAIHDVLGYGVDVEIDPETANRNGLKKVRYSVEWNTFSSAITPECPVYIRLTTSRGKETASYLWDTEQCQNVHNAIVDVYNTVVRKK